MGTPTWLGQILLYLSQAASGISISGTIQGCRTGNSEGKAIKGMDSEEKRGAHCR